MDIVPGRGNGGQSLKGENSVSDFQEMNGSITMGDAGLKEVTRLAAGETGLIIAVDGPAGAGKSTVAQAVAKRLGYVYIDTGAMYRALTLHAAQVGIAPNDGQGLCRILQEVDIRLANQPNAAEKNRVLLNGDDVTEAIRSPQVTAAVSQVASHSAVRKHMVKLQQALASEGGVVMDGRDIGTTVLPNAGLKVFLTANVTARAERRWRELQAVGHQVDFEDVRSAILERDRQDREREESPLRQASDAIVIDTTHRQVDDVVNEVLALVAERTRGRASGR